MEKEKSKISIQQILMTIAAAGINSSVALSISIYGPTLVDLQTRLQTDLESVSYLFTARGIAALIGSLVLGPLFDYIDNLFLLGLIGTIGSVCLGMTLWTTSLVTFLCAMAPTGVYDVAISMGANLLISKLWKDKAEHFFQIFNFFFAITYAIGPLLTKPFLREKIKSNITENGTLYITTAELTVSRNTCCQGDFNDGGYMLSDITTDMPHEQTSLLTNIIVQYVYFIVAVFILFWSVMCFILFCKYADGFRDKYTQSKSTKKNNQPVNFDWFTGLSYLLFCFSMFFYNTLATCYSGLVLTFVVDYLAWSKSDGVYASFLFSVGKLVASVVAMIALKKLKPRTILLIDFLINIAAMMVLATVLTTYPPIVWVCSFVVGFGQGSIVPMNLAYAYEHGLVTGKFSSAFWTGFYIGALSGPPFLSYLYKRIHPMYFAYICLAVSVGMLVTFSIFTFLVKLRRNQSETTIYKIDKTKSGVTTKL